MNGYSVVVTALFAGAWLGTSGSIARAAPCLIVTLTGTQGGPQSFNGLAGAGTLVRYGDETDECGTLKLQFDAGRGTTMRLSRLGIGPEQLNAIFFTHMHSDHTEGFPDLVQLRWSFNGTGPKIDVICSADAVSPSGATISCRKFTAHIADAFIQSGEIAQRHSELKERTEGGPAELVNTITFQPRNEPQVVWSFGDLKVSAVRSTHIAGHASYRVDTPAGSVVTVATPVTMRPHRRVARQHQSRSRRWPEVRTLSCTRRSTQLWAQTREAECSHMLISGKAQSPTSVLWPSARARNT